jgi:hypothetical protein
LGTRAGGACLVSSGSSDLDVKGGDAQFLALFGNVLGGKHSGVGGRFVAIGLDLHSSGNTNEGFSSRKIGDVNESVIEGSKEVGNSKDFLSVLDADSANFLGLFFTVVSKNARNTYIRYGYGYLLRA